METNGKQKAILALMAVGILAIVTKLLLVILSLVLFLRGRAAEAIYVYLISGAIVVKTGG